MKQSERRLLWQSRIQAFQTSGETSVATWCVKQGVPVQSMYQWVSQQLYKKTFSFIPFRRISLFSVIEEKIN